MDLAQIWIYAKNVVLPFFISVGVVGFIIQFSVHIIKSRKTRKQEKALLEGFMRLSNNIPDDLLSTKQILSIEACAKMVGPHRGRLLEYYQKQFELYLILLDEVEAHLRIPYNGHNSHPLEAALKKLKDFKID